MGLHTWRFLSIYFKFRQKGFSHIVSCWVAKDLDVCTSSKTVNDIIALQFAAQVEKAHRLQGEGSCQHKGAGCKVFTASALKKQMRVAWKMLVHNKKVRFLICFWKAGGKMSTASEEVRMNSSAKETSTCSVLLELRQSSRD